MKAKFPKIQMLTTFYLVVFGVSVAFWAGMENREKISSRQLAYVPQTETSVSSDTLLSPPPHTHIAPGKKVEPTEKPQPDYTPWEFKFNFHAAVEWLFGFILGRLA